MKFRDISRKIRAPFNRRSAFNKLKQFHSKKRSVDEIIDMAMDFKTRGLYRIDSVQQREEILALATAVQELNPVTILEIGTCNGGTLFIWSNLASECVITCDLNKTKIREELYKSFPPPSSSCEVISLTGDSHEQSFLEKVKQSLNGRKVDFLFIDGDHTEAGVRLDYKMYSSLVRPGGIIAFHDILEKHPVPDNQVYYFWKEIKQSTNSEEFVKDYNQTGFGIGIIRVE
ncbi:MAG: class I SAM-dependent methyltransferase [Gammaproteobacteria bacterium]|jgi:predicted O-methyltransferase YrrM